MEEKGDGRKEMEEENGEIRGNGERRGVEEEENRKTRRKEKIWKEKGRNRGNAT